MSDDSPDGCPVHDLARTDPGATVQIYDEHGRYLGPASAELACDGHHVGAIIKKKLAEALAKAPRWIEAPDDGDRHMW